MASRRVETLVCVWKRSVQSEPAPLPYVCACTSGWGWRTAGECEGLRPPSPLCAPRRNYLYRGSSFLKAAQVVPGRGCTVTGREHASQSGTWACRRAHACISVSFILSKWKVRKSGFLKLYETIIYFAKDVLSTKKITPGFLKITDSFSIL